MQLVAMTGRWQKNFDRDNNIFNNNNSSNNNNNNNNNTSSSSRETMTGSLMPLALRIVTTGYRLFVQEEEEEQEEPLPMWSRILPPW